MKKRKLLAFFLALVMCAGLFASCGEGQEDKSKTSEVSVEEVKEETKEEAKSEVKETEEEAKEEAKSEVKEAEEEAISEVEEAAQEEAAAEEPKEEVTAESLLKNYFDTAEDIESLSFDIAMNADLAMTQGENQMDMSMAMDVYFESCGDNAYMSGTMNMEQASEQESDTVEQYIMLEGDKYVTYSYDKETDSWTSYESDKPALSKDLIPQIDASGFNLEEEGDQYKVSGSVDITKMIETMGDTFSSLFDNMFGSSEGITGEANVVYFFDKETKALTAVHIDMAQALEDTFTAMLTALFSMQLGGEDEEIPAEELATLFSIDVNVFEFNLDNMLFNEGKEIVLPEEAKNATSESSSEM